ncbi:MAG: hypothetical protein AAF827_11285 [Cyanobacteria bacterium P01_D01_bin.6]
MNFSLSRNGNIAIIRTSWIIRSGENVPRLVSCYIVR